jgi:hypothetical protein
MDGKSKDRGFIDIWFSVLGGGDFARYVIGTNSGSCSWSGRKLKDPEPNRKKLLENFKKQVTIKQKEMLEKAMNPFFGINLSKMPAHIDFTTHNTKKKLSEKEIKQREIEEKKRQQKAFTKFENYLSEKQKAYFRREIKPFFDDRGCINDPFERFDLTIAQRWIFNRVAELGYDPKLHGEFDNNVNSYYNTGRSNHKTERIGKKYQWIAYHEFMALVSDHFEFKGDRWSASVYGYKGAWQPRIRDIDPSFILQNDDHINKTLTLSEWRKTQGNYDAWEKDRSDVDWIKTNIDLPNPKKIIQITDDNMREWLMLEGYLNWQEKTPPEHKKYEIPIREFWYIIKSYIVKKKDFMEFFDWAKKQDFMGRWMPESHDFHEIFLGEYRASIAFEDLSCNSNDWTEAGKGAQALKTPVVVTDDSYLNEFTLDCSYNGSVSVQLPCKWLVKEMNLHHKYLDGRFYDNNENLVTIDTNIFEGNFPAALLIDKQLILEYLNKNDYVIFWTLLGEKQLIGGSFSRKDFVGRQEISGCYTINTKGKIYGESHNKFNK